MYGVGHNKYWSVQSKAGARNLEEAHSVLSVLLVLGRVRGGLFDFILQVVKSYWMQCGHGE